MVLLININLMSKGHPKPINNQQININNEIKQMDRQYKHQRLLSSIKLLQTLHNSMIKIRVRTTMEVLETNNLCVWK